MGKLHGEKGAGIVGMKLHLCVGRHAANCGIKQFDDRIYENRNLGTASILQMR